MRKPLVSLAVILSLVTCFELWGAVKGNDGLEIVLGKYVKGGVPDYDMLKRKGLKDLNGYISTLASLDPSGLQTENEKTAFWINAYNAFALKLVAENYPSKQDIFKVEGFFDLKKMTIGGRELSLNNISSEELLFGKETKDARINFALFNGTKGSPKLFNRPFDAKTLDADLEKCAKEFIQNSQNVFLDRENKVPDPSKVKGITPEQYDKLGKDFTILRLSPLFSWFESDFREHSGSVVRFVAKYAQREDAEYIRENEGKIVVDYNAYDWAFAGFGR